ncbi:hypothetical protein SCALM49S_06924 [Streptomyces californicus]
MLAARDALLALAGNSAGSVLGAEESAYLRPLLDAFWGSRADASRRDRAAKELRAAFSVMPAGPGPAGDPRRRAAVRRGPPLDGSAGPLRPGG